MEQSTTRSEFEQGRAKAAYEHVQQAKKRLKPEVQKEYKAYAKKLSMLIMTNGLGNVLAFMEAKAHKNKAWELLRDQLSDWVGDTQQHLIRFERGRFLKAMMDAESITYRAVTKQVLAYLGWIRKFADGQIKGNATMNND